MLQAKDADQPNTKNSEIRYEIISGNYDKKFGINEKTGKIFVLEALGLGNAMEDGRSFESKSLDYVGANIRYSKLRSSGMI